MLGAVVRGAVTVGAAWIGAVALAASTALAQSTASATAERPVHGGWAVRAGAAIKLHVASGSVEITGWARDSVHLEGTMAAGESVFGIGSLAALKFGAEGRTTRGASRLRVSVPTTAELVVRSGAADVTVHDVRGMVDIGAAAGHVRVTGTPAMLLIEALAGDVHAQVTSATVRVRANRGAVTLRGRVHEAQLTTVSGAITVNADTLPALRINTVGGAVQVATTTPLLAPVTIETFGGDVVVRRPLGGADERLHSDSGRIVVDGRPLRTDASPRPPRSGRAVSAPLTVQSFRGFITVHAGPP